MTLEEELKRAKQLRLKTGIGTIASQKALRICNWDEDMAIKFLHDYPFMTYIPTTGFWLKNKCSFCKQCDRFVVVSVNTDRCETCGEIFKD